MRNSEDVTRNGQEQRDKEGRRLKKIASMKKSNVEQHRRNMKKKENALQPRPKKKLRKKKMIERERNSVDLMSLQKQHRKIERLRPNEERKLKDEKKRTDQLKRQEEGNMKGKPPKMLEGMQMKRDGKRTKRKGETSKEELRNQAKLLNKIARRKSDADQLLRKENIMIG